MCAHTTKHAARTTIFVQKIQMDAFQTCITALADPVNIATGLLLKMHFIAKVISFFPPASEILHKLGVISLLVRKLVLA